VKFNSRRFLRRFCWGGAEEVEIEDDAVFIFISQLLLLSQ
jgi:hypothetical protein